MEKIEKNLEMYLESKRKDFPRFYFISNDELLQILASAQEIEKVEKHLNKCFDNICALEYTSDAGATEVQGMISSEKEKVIFNKAVKIRQGTNVEAWLKDVQDAMSDTLKKIMKVGYNDYYDASRERKDWVRKHAGQVIATIGQVTWTESVEQAFGDIETNPNSVSELFDMNVQQLSQLTELIRGELSSVERKILVALITTDVHARDIVEKLAFEGIQSIHDFNWQQ